MSEALPSFDDLQRVLAQSHALTDAAEAHGTLVGALCASEFSLDDWLAEILPEGRAEGLAGEHLRVLFDLTNGSLGDIASTFGPLLPSDDAPIAERTAALGEWCQGFLHGFGTGALPQSPALEGDAAEVLRDLGEITRVDVDPEEDGERNETAYAELVEFVRVGVQLLYVQLSPQRLPQEQPQREVLH